MCRCFFLGGLAGGVLVKIGDGDDVAAAHLEPRGLAMRADTDPRTSDTLLEDAASSDPPLAIFIDIHSHSAKLSSFMYCNSHDDTEKLEAETVLPSLMDARSPYFSFASSKFCRDPSHARGVTKKKSACIHHR